MYDIEPNTKLHLHVPRRIRSKIYERLVKFLQAYTEANRMKA